MGLGNGTGSVRFKADVTLLTSFSFYRKNYKNRLLKADYIRLNRAFNIFIIEQVEKGNRVNLPGSLGSIFVRGTKRKITFDEKGNPNLAISWAKTFQLWSENLKAKKEKKLIYCTNEHTDGITYKIRWSQRGAFVQNKLYYSFIPVQAFRKRISAAIFNGMRYEYKDVSSNNDYKKSTEKVSAKKDNSEMENRILDALKK